MTALPSRLSLGFQLRSSWTGLKVLIGELGLAGAAAVGLKMIGRQIAGQPWNELPAVEDQKEKLSRDQAAQAVLLYRALIDQIGKDDALALMEKIILEASLIFLREQVPKIEPKKIEAMSETQRIAFLQSICDRFFNADTGPLEINDNSFSYEITRCRFPELMAKVGHSELAPLFCKGDALFFDQDQPFVRFSRTVTMAADGKPCDFHFQLISEK